MGRMWAGQLAPTDTGKALEAARGCPDAWYRVQALASVAMHADPHVVLSVLKEAAREALSCHDAYGRVAVMAWPLEVAYSRGHRSYAKDELKKALLLAPKVEPCASRAFALQILWGGCYAAGEEFAEPVWQAILCLCNPDRHWRETRLFRHIAEVKESRHPGGAAEVIAAMPVGKARAALERRFKAV